MDQDKISHLPKVILHDILSSLPAKDVARTSVCVLSKAWAETWSMFPILSFSDIKIARTSSQSMEDYVRKRKNFLDYVWKRLLRFSNQGLVIKEFKLNIILQEDVFRHVDVWMKLVTESHVEVLQLYMRKKDEEAQDQCYVMPKGVLEAKSLKKLVLSGGIRVDQAFLNHSIKFFSLRVLSLGYVLLGDEQAIEHLFSRCPLLENITLTKCFVLNSCGMRGLLYRIRMQGLPKLKEVELEGMQEVYIDAPNLENLHYNPGDFQAPCKMDFDRCENMRGLYLWYLSDIIIRDKWFPELFLKFPFLENLVFVTCTMPQRINISSEKLKVLLLSNCSNLEEIDIDAPNLLSFEYNGVGASQPIISFRRSSSQLKINVTADRKYLQLSDLSRFIQNFKPQNVLASLSLFIYELFERGRNPDFFQVSSPPPSIEHLYLYVAPLEETFYLPFFYSLLSNFRPSTISMLPDFCDRAFIEFFYEKLMRRKEEDCFCDSDHTRCWWHGLKEIKVMNSIKTHKDADLKTILDALMHLENISFKLEF